MRGRARRWAAAMTVLLGVVVAAVQAGAQPATGEITVGEIDTLGFPAVETTVAVPGSVATGLVPPESFRVIENGIPRTPEVQPLPAEELQVLLVVDTSGSMTGVPLQAAKVAAKTFLAEMPAGTRIGLIGFGPAAFVASSPSLDRPAVARAIDGLKAEGRTALYDAVATAVDHFQPGDRLRRAVVLLSDGGDTASASTLDAAAGKLAEADVHLEVAELVTAERDPAALARLAAAGGGRVAAAEDPKALSPIYRAIATSLTNQYRLRFRSGSSGRTELVFLIEHAGIRAERRLTFDFPILPQDPFASSRNGFLTGAGALVVGGLAFFCAIALAGMMAFAAPAGVGVQRLGGTHPAWLRPTPVGRLSGFLGRAVEAGLARTGRLSPLQLTLERAGIATGAGDFAVVWGCSAAFAVILGLRLAGPVLALVLLALVAVVSRVVIRVMIRRRQAAFADQLVDTLQIIAGSLRAGYGLMQACEAVAVEAYPPTSHEFRRVLNEARLGRDSIEALGGVAERVGSPDFQWVVSAIEIHRDVGGNLAEVLDNVASTIRDRDQVRRQIKALSADGRLSAYVLVGVPIALFAIIRIMNPEYMSELNHGVGRVLLIGAIVLMTIGALWLKRLCRLVF